MDTIIDRLFLVALSIAALNVVPLLLGELDVVSMDAVGFIIGSVALAAFIPVYVALAVEHHAINKASLAEPPKCGEIEKDIG